jgi:hypothetical protein
MVAAAHRHRQRKGVIAHAGTAALRLVADRTGLT